MARVSITIHSSHHSAPAPQPTQLCFSMFLVGDNFWCKHKRRVSRKNHRLQHRRCPQGCDLVVLTPGRFCPRDTERCLETLAVSGQTHQPSPAILWHIMPLSP